MSVLNDEALDNLLSPPDPLVSKTRQNELGRWNSRVQPASIDLTIGEIFVPGTPENEIGSEDQPLHELQLEQGQTAVVRTAEELSLPTNVAGLRFPPASVSLRGILMTNTGHIDPGFKGRMVFTVINIAQHSYQLKAGATIATIVFLYMSAPPKHGYQQLYRDDKPPLPKLNGGLLRILSKDFMDIDNRAKEAAGEEVRRIDLDTKHKQIRVPIVTASITAIFAALATVFVQGLGFFNNTNDRLTKVEAKIESSQFTERLSDLTTRIEQIESNIAPQK